MSDHFTIRRGTEGDTPVVAVVWAELLTENPNAGWTGGRPLEESVQFFRDLWTGYARGVERGVALVALGEGRPVGFLLWGAVPGGGNLDPETAMGWGTWVDPEVRGLGVSRALRARAGALLRDLGFARVLGSADPAKGAALHSALHAGFRITSVNLTWDLVAAYPSLDLAFKGANDASSPHQVQATPPSPPE